MFAKDTKIYHEINNAEDTLALPSDLDCLEYWTRNWQVTFNPQKCEVMRITHKQDKSKHPYHLSNTELESVNSCKDLGLLKRTVGSKNREIFSMLYKSSIRPILEYAWPVWSPCLVKDKLAIVLSVFFGRRIERLKIAVRARGGGGGYTTNFCKGRLRPEVQPLTLLYTTFHEKGSPFVYLLLTNGTNFTDLV